MIGNWSVGEIGKEMTVGDKVELGDVSDVAFPENISWKMYGNFPNNQKNMFDS